MPLVPGQSAIIARARWAYEYDHTGFDDATQGEPLSHILTPVGEYNHIFAAQYTIAAAGTQAVDLYGPFTSLALESVTTTQAIAGYVYVEGNNGALKIEPHSTDGLSWPVVGGTETLTPGTAGAGDVWMDGVMTTVSSSSRQWLLTNTGSADIAVTLIVYVTSLVWSFNFSQQHNSGYLAAL